MSARLIEAEAPAEKLTMWSSFASADLEQAFCLRELPGSIHRMRILLLISCSTFFLHLWADHEFFGDSYVYYVLTAMRAVVVSVGLMALWRSSRTTSPKIFTSWAVTWALSAGTLLVYTIVHRPPSYIGYLAVVTFCVLLTYCVMPIPLLSQLVLGTGISAVILYVLHPADPMVLVALAASLTSANLVGFLVSRELNIWKRQQYVALEREKRMRQGLEQALIEIKQLRGILPICAHCKKIRDDKGYWHQVETYVARHTEAAFSHGICPECVTAHFADLSLSDNPDNEVSRVTLFPPEDRSVE